MYIKKVKKYNKGSDKYYEYLHLVENIRTVNGPRQRLILNLGNIKIAEDQYKSLANCIEGILTGQQSLMSYDSQIEQHAQNAVRRIIKARSKEEDHEISEPEYQQLDITSIEASEPRSIGAEYVCNNIWNEMQIDNILTNEGIIKEHLQMIKMSVIGRLVDPGSELHTWQWADKRSAIYELTGKPHRYSLSSLYRAGDKLFSCKEVLESHLNKKEKDIFSLQEKLCFFDLTNTYFEGEVKKNNKAKRGKSKEKRSDCKLTTLALVIDEQGFVKHSSLYPGNQYEGDTLIDIIESLSRNNTGTDKTIIIDAGIATENNIKLLKERKYNYIAVNRDKSDITAENTADMEVIKYDKKGNILLEVYRQEKKDEVYLLCRSAGRKKKDRGIRSRSEKLFIERLEYYKSGLSKRGHTKNHIKLVEMIGRLREKYPKASKLYDVEVIPETPNQKAKDIVWKKRPKHNDQDKLDGCYILRTNRKDFSDKEILETYHMLTKVERAFCSMKSSLGLRPNFHQNETRADAHMFISVLAYHILHVIEYRLQQNKDYRSWNTIRNILSTHQRLTIEYTAKTKTGLQRHHIRLCSKAEPEHKLIYKSLGYSFIPLSRRFYKLQNQ